MWALERLAWSSEHFARVATVLAGLAELDPGGQISNRPAGSLSGLFLPWIRFSEFADVDPLQTLAMLLYKYPNSGWQLLIDAYPSSHPILIKILARDLLFIRQTPK